MSRLEELIEKLCPDGVEYRKIVDVAEVSIGEFVHKSKQNPNSQYPVFNGGTSNTGFYDEYNRTANKIIISARGANAGFVNRVFTNFWSGNSCYTVDFSNDAVDWNFAFYWLKSKEKKLLGEQQKGGIPAVSKKQVENFLIPVPPLEVQSEIVRILDNFTELTAELTEKLTAELTARKKQYEYYSANLLCFGENVSWIPLSELCSIKGRIGFRGYTTKDMVDQGNGAISLSPGNIQNHTLICENCTYITWDKYYESPEIMIDINDVLFCKTGSTLGKVCIVESLPEKATINPQLVVLKDIYCNYRYLKHYMTTSPFQREVQKRKGLGSVPNISQKELGCIEIPIPPLEEQQRIVDILDRFDKLCNDISEGLPAEIEARKKQYEYYRDKLLTFKEKVV